MTLLACLTIREPRRMATAPLRLRPGRQPRAPRVWALLQSTRTRVPLQSVRPLLRTMRTREQRRPGKAVQPSWRACGLRRRLHTTKGPGAAGLGRPCCASVGGRRLARSTGHRCVRTLPASTLVGQLRFFSAGCCISGLPHLRSTSSCPFARMQSPQWSNRPLQALPRLPPRSERSPASDLTQAQALRSRPRPT